jgi:glycerol-3-phosphate dehydrogenase
MIRLGLWLYDHLAPREFLPGCEHIDLSSHAVGKPLKPLWKEGFMYSDGWVDDARLVVLCAQDARSKGASVLTRTRCDQLQRHAEGWRALLAHHHAHTGQLTHHVTVQASVVVNAAGPWADRVQQMMQPRGAAPARRLRLVKGSHIVVPRLFQHEQAYIFQGKDGRIVFAIPYEQRFTLVGTTDVDVQGDPAQVSIDDAEVLYLCDAVSRYFRQPVSTADVVWHYSGVRPLMDDARGSASAVTRDYRLEHAAGVSPWLTVWGGKITTFRKLAEEASHVVGDLLGDRRPGWTRDAVLPGGRLLDLIESEVDPVTDLAEFQRLLRKRHPWMDLAMVRRWSHQFGGDTLRLLEGVRSREDLGAEVAPGLYETELFYLRHQEWACTGDDVLWRRTKLGLHLDAAQREAVQRWMATDH